MTTQPVPTTAPLRHGTPAAAFSHRTFRWVFLGSFASNIGTWMQNVALQAFAFSLTGDARLMGIVAFAQLGPMLFLSPFGGVVADRIDRKVVMVTAASVQALMSIALAAVATEGRQASQPLIVGCVAVIGIAAALNAPAAQATVPALVPREDLSGAVSLNSAQMNASRVLGPLLAVIPFLEDHTVVFLVNAATYLFVIAAVLLVPFDSSPAHRVGRARPIGDLLDGVAEARRDPVIGRALATVAAYSLCSLVFIYQLAGIAKERFGLEDDGYRLLFAAFGLGAASGAIAVGTRLRAVDRTVLVRTGLAGFAVSLGAFALIDSPGLAYPVIGVVGIFYFIVITALSTALQHEVSDAARGRVMGLWMMAWAGLVPVGSLIAGFVIDEVGYPAVLIFGAVVALALIPLADLRGSIPEPPDPTPQPDFL